MKNLNEEEICECGLTLLQHSGLKNINRSSGKLNCKKFKPQNQDENSERTSVTIMSPDTLRGIFDVSDLCMNGIPIGALNEVIVKERQRIKAEVEKVLDERIKSYKELHNKSPKQQLFLAKWEAIEELKKRLFG